MLVLSTALRLLEEAEAPHMDRFEYWKRQLQREGGKGQRALQLSSKQYSYSKLTFILIFQKIPSASLLFISWHILYRMLSLQLYFPCPWLDIQIENPLHFILIMLTTEQQQKALGALLQKKQNSLCADCNGKSPCWASIDFGVFVCMNCSGAHRFLGPTTTRVRSTKLDTWNREWLENMRVGNTVLNEYWEHELTGINRTVKPNINTSVSDIIKFVQDKYVKKKYVDPEQSLDPLRRSKLPPEIKSQIVQPKQNVQKSVKEAVKQPSNNNNQSPFNAFSNLVANKQKQTRKSSDNLISFEKQATNLIENTTEAPKLQQQQKHNHAQFHTVSGSKPKQEEQFISFENLVKVNEPAAKLPPHPHHPPQPAHNNYLLNPSAPHYHVNAGHYSTGHFGNHPNYHPPQQYDRAQYVTMNINMNMYPKVMNINMNPQTNNNYLQQPQQQQTNFADQFLGQQVQPQKQAQNEVKITLDSNISLETFKKEKEVPKSWIDDWK